MSYFKLAKVLVGYRYSCTGLFVFACLAPSQLWSCQIGSEISLRPTWQWKTYHSQAFFFFCINNGSLGHLAVCLTELAAMSLEGKASTVAQQKWKCFGDTCPRGWWCGIGIMHNVSAPTARILDCDAGVGLQRLTNWGGGAGGASSQPFKFVLHLLSSISFIFPSDISVG